MISKDIAINLISEKIDEGYSIKSIYEENFGWIILLNLPDDSVIYGGFDAFLVDKYLAKAIPFNTRYLKVFISNYQSNNQYELKIKNESIIEKETQVNINNYTNIYRKTKEFFNKLFK